MRSNDYSYLGDFRAAPIGWEGSLRYSGEMIDKLRRDNLALSRLVLDPRRLPKLRYFVEKIEARDEPVLTLNRGPQVGGSS